jgi:hypothetical protein
VHLVQFSHRNFEIFRFGGNICAHDATHRLDIQTGVGASERAYQTVYYASWSIFLRGSGASGAGLWKFPTGISKFLGVWGSLVRHRSSHRPDRDMGVGTY